MRIRVLSIIGVGLLGGSIGLSAKKRIKHVKIIGYSHRPSTLQRALQIGAIDQISSKPADAVRDADLVILCTPVGVFGQILRDISTGLNKSAIVTDVGSTKASVVRQGEALIGPRFVGSHPMAGSEKRGVEFARADLFDKALCILTPTRQTDQDALVSVRSFWETLGMRLTQLTAAKHDAMLAEVSHLPHVVAAALVGVQSGGSAKLGGRGFLDTTRIAAGDGALWRDILLDNRINVLNSLEKMRAELSQVERMLKDDDAAALCKWLDQRRRKRIAAEK